MQDLTFKKDFEITLNMEAADSYAKALQGDYSKSLLGEVDIIVLSQPRLSLKNKGHKVTVTRSMKQDIGAHYVNKLSCSKPTEGLHIFQVPSDAK